MNIIVGTEAAEKLKENYTVLELETFSRGDDKITAYCVVNEIPIMELSDLEQYKQLHADFVKEYYAGNFSFCINAAEHLKGRFNGELDSFYDIILERIS